MKRGISINQSQGIASQLCNVHNSTPHSQGSSRSHSWLPLKPISARSLILQSSTNPSLYIIYHKLKVRALNIVHLSYRLVQLVHWITKLLHTVLHRSNSFRTHSLAFEIFTIIVEVDLADDHVPDYLSFIWNYFFFLSLLLLFPNFRTPFHLGALGNSLIGLLEWPALDVPIFLSFIWNFFFFLLSFLFQNFGASFPLVGLRQWPYWPSERTGPLWLLSCHFDIHYFKKYHKNQQIFMLIMTVYTQNWYEIIFHNMISAKKPKMHLNKLLTSMIQISYITINFMK